MAVTATDTKQLAEGYAKAWTSGDVETALTFLGEDVVCDAPSGRIEGVAAYRPFTQKFVDRLVKATVTKVLADEGSAAIVYSFDTPWIKDFRCAEYMTIEDGKIRHITTIFDRLPAAEAATAAKAAENTQG
ncbi:nuclear transport factor 2 family protein [Streptomyces milbemycinicus]|uniref:nuclear transport factor 2 family protein n=1 Tax=Streptomyces milbemycinicus TaxID=476552 RepID=UPI0033EC9DF3